MTRRDNQHPKHPLRATAKAAILNPLRHTITIQIVAQISSRLSRYMDPFEQDLIDQNTIPVVEPGSNLAKDLRNAIVGRPVYVHLDCDVLNPGIVPTNFVVEGGMSLDDLHTCAVVIAEHDFVGIEIAEFQSTWEPGGDEVSLDPLLDALAPVLRASPS